MRYTPPDLRKDDSFHLVAAAEPKDNPNEVVASLKIVPKIYIFSCKFVMSEWLRWQSAGLPIERSVTLAYQPISDALYQWIYLFKNLRIINIAPSAPQ